MELYTWLWRLLFVNYLCFIPVSCQTSRPMQANSSRTQANATVKITRSTQEVGTTQARMTIPTIRTINAARIRPAARIRQTLRMRQAAKTSQVDRTVQQDMTSPHTGGKCTAKSKNTPVDYQTTEKLSIHLQIWRFMS